MHVFILLGFNDNKVSLKYFHIFPFGSGRTFQRYIGNDNPTIDSDMACQAIFTASNFWSDYSCNFNISNSYPQNGRNGNYILALEVMNPMLPCCVGTG